MPLPTFASLEEVPDVIRSEYEMIDGKAVSRDIAKLTAAIAKERESASVADKARKDAEKRLADLETTNKAQKSGISDEQLAALRADLEKQLAPERAAREAAEQQLRELRLDASLKSIMAASGVRAERIDTLWKLTGDRFDLSENGTPIVKASPTVDVKANVAALVSEYPEFFAAPPANGGGAQKSGTLPRGMDVDAMLKNPMELLKMANALPLKAA